MSILSEGVRYVKPGEFTGDSSEVCPDWLRFVEVIGLKGVPAGGGWVDCAFRYRKPNGTFYVLEAALQVNAHLEQTGVAYLRCCTCPDYNKRRGPSKLQSRERLCKHMRALRVRLIQQAGQPAPQIDSLPLGVFTRHELVRAALGKAVVA